MPSATGGINTLQLSPNSALLLRRENYINPEIVDVDKVVASVDPSSAATVGTALTLTAAVSGFLLRRARRVTVVVTDATVVAASELSVSILLVGFRQGIAITETVTATAVASGTPVTGTSVALFDQVVSATPTRIANAAAGDALTVGISGGAFGLDRRILKVGSVCSIIQIENGTEAAPTAVSATTVDVANYCIQGIALDITDNWEIQYTADGPDGIGRGHGART